MRPSLPRRKLSGMRCCLAFPLLLASTFLALPAGAQRGGAAHAAGGFGGGAHSGGFPGHSAPASRSPFGGSHPYPGASARSGAQASRFGAPGVRYPASRYAQARPGYPTSARPAFYTRAGSGENGYASDRFRRGGYRGPYAYGLPYGYPFSLFDPFLSSYLNSDSFWDGTESFGFPDSPGTSAPAYGDPSGAGNAVTTDFYDGYGPAAAAPAQAQSQQAPSPYWQPSYAPMALPNAVPRLQQAEPQEAAVTLIFNNGRAPEQIRNYALSRTTLYVTDGRPREIPLDQIDLPTTERINHDAGIRFQLPNAN